MKNRNLLKCPKCGVEIYTNAKERACYKCETQMIFICKEYDFLIKIKGGKK